MKNLFLITLISVFSISVYGQEIDINTSYNWNTLKKSGFYESSTAHTLNLPNNMYDWYWGINIAHSNRGTESNPWYWGGQIIMPIERNNGIPQMYIRSTNQNGEGQWAKLLTDQGKQTINAGLSVNDNIEAGKDIRLSNGEITFVYNDNFIYDNKPLGFYSMKWSFDSWNPGAPSLWLSGLGGVKLFTGGKANMVIHSNGNIGIGTENPQNKLDVAGTIRAQEIKVEMTGWADYVFDKDYKLPSLQEVKSHIEEHKHLPGIPSEKKVLEEVVNMGEMQAKLLQKIEELTLYVIEQQREIDELKSKLNNE